MTGAAVAVLVDRRAVVAVVQALEGRLSVQTGYHIVLMTQRRHLEGVRRRLWRRIRRQVPAPPHSAAVLRLHPGVSSAVHLEHTGAEGGGGGGRPLADQGRVQEPSAPLQGRPQGGGAGRRRLADGELRHRPDLWFSGRDRDPLLLFLVLPAQPALPDTIKQI